jgi:hypothetical protein
MITMGHEETTIVRRYGAKQTPEKTGTRAQRKAMGTHRTKTELVFEWERLTNFLVVI